MNNRPKIPTEVADELLVSCNHECCICDNTTSLIHHIDGNRRNNNPDNLIPLCPNHHNLVHASESSLTRRITERQLLMYKQRKIDSVKAKHPMIVNEFKEIVASIEELRGDIRSLKKWA